ncbi:MAG: hypothetical protein QOF83_3976 [Solirubrobacteraceae bacterium]|jgi:hypothetical protein|nr:hypothetical protein [Solirubrobacteraceae bacterium]
MRLGGVPTEYELTSGGTICAPTVKEGMGK